MFYFQDASSLGEGFIFLFIARLQVSKINWKIAKNVDDNSHEFVAIQKDES